MIQFADSIYLPAEIKFLDILTKIFYGWMLFIATKDLFSFLFPVEINYNLVKIFQTD